MLSLTPPLAIRMETSQDRDFVLRLYCESREDLLVLASQPEVFEPLMQMQLNSHLQGLQRAYPQSQSWLIERFGQTIARVVVDLCAGDLRLLDLAVSMTARSQGIGQQILRALQKFADQHHLSISLSVMHSNYRAIGLYRKCGFYQSSEDGLIAQMCWHAPVFD